MGGSWNTGYYGIIQQFYTKFKSIQYENHCILLYNIQGGPKVGTQYIVYSIKYSIDGSSQILTFS